MTTVDLRKPSSKIDEFLKKDANSLLYSSSIFINLISAYLDCEAHYLVASKYNKIIGVLPFIIKANKTFGPVLNSLPYYGSNGGITLASDLQLSEANIIIETLTTALLNYINLAKCSASTLVLSPFTPEHEQIIKPILKPDFEDYRIGQITHLPETENEQELLSIFKNPRPRNIRKAIKSKVVVRTSWDMKDMEFLFKTHKSNIEAIGGLAKDWNFFELVANKCQNENFKIWVAEVDGAPISALLLFYFNETVEYFTPATIHDYRNLQPSSLLIFEAMKDAVANNYKNWNWGGTWKTQTGVYQFKQKWGAKDHEYKYLTNIFNKKLLALSPEDILLQFPNFYTINFNDLPTSGKN